MDVFVGVIGTKVFVEVTVIVGGMGGGVAVSVGGGGVNVKVILGARSVFVGGPAEGVSSAPVCGMIGILQASINARMAGRINRRVFIKRLFIQSPPGQRTLNSLYSCELLKQVKQLLVI
jgi:hypothetical protein